VAGIYSLILSNRVFAIMNNVYDDACKSWLKIEGWCSLYILAPKTSTLKDYVQGMIGSNYRE